MQVEQYLISEVERQHSTNFSWFEDAYWFAANQDVFTPIVLQTMARFVEKEINVFVGSDNYRRSHVGFFGGGNAAPVGEVRHRMQRWWNLVEEISPTEDVELVDLQVKSLLQIHPWQDGNGRTASILRNFWLGKLEDPEPLPCYEF